MRERGGRERGRESERGGEREGEREREREREVSKKKKKNSVVLGWHGAEWGRSRRRRCLLGTCPSRCLQESVPLFSMTLLADKSEEVNKRTRGWTRRP